MSDFKELKNALMKLDRERQHLNFLTTCRDLGIIPKFLRTRSKYVSHFHTRKKYNFELACLKAVIRTKHALVDMLYRRIYGYRNSGLYYNFARHSVNGVFDHSMRIINEFRNVQELQMVDRHTKKLMKLTNSVSGTNDEITSNKVSGFVNLTNHVFTDEQMHVLNKGPKHVIPRSILPINFIPQLEDLLRDIEPQHREEVRHQLFFTYSKHLKSNKFFKSHENHILNSIRAIPNIIFIQTDKSNKLAAIEKPDFMQKMQDIIQSIDCSPISSDPLNSIVNKTNKISREFKMSTWPDNIRNLAKVNHLGVIPKMIAVIKDHKPSMPLRPIVVRSQAPTFFIEKVLVIILRDVLPLSPHALKSTKDFIQRLENIQLPSDFVMYSLDVVSLYPSVDMNIAAQNIHTQLSANQSLSDHMKKIIISAFNLVKASNYFVFNSQIYFQNTGAPMGSPISGIAAEFILRPLEEGFLANAPIQPLCWLRYVDDVFCLWTSSQAEFKNFYDSLNQYDPRIKFTVETEVNNRLAFLDVQLTRYNNTIKRSVYRKPNNSNCTIPNNSYTTLAYKQAAYKTHVRRAHVICTQDTIDEELNTIRKIALQNGFSIAFINEIIHNVAESVKHPPAQENRSSPKRISIQYTQGLHEKLTKILKPHNIQLVAQSGFKLKQALKTNFDPIPMAKLPGVYEIPMIHQNHTKSFYIGQTMRKLEIRLKEHQQDIKRAKQTTAISRTAYNNPGTSILFNEAKIIAPFTTSARTIIRETLEIHKRRTNICNDQDSFNVPDIWLSLI